MLVKLIRHWLRPLFVIRDEEWTGDDQKRYDSFVTGGLVSAVEKKLRMRMVELRQHIVTNAGDPSAMESKAALEELEDVLIEWKNLRTDLTKSDAQ